MSDRPFVEIREWLAQTDPAPDTPYYRDTRRYIDQLLVAYDDLAHRVSELQRLNDSLIQAVLGDGIEKAKIARQLEALKAQCLTAKEDLIEGDKKIEQLEARLAEVYREAADLMKAKASYDVDIDLRVRGEYVRTYEFIQELADRAKIHD